jgi:hypothetical protein
VYRAVIEDVIRNVRNDFLNMGVDEQTLQELQHVKPILLGDLVMGNKVNSISSVTWKL